MLGEAKVDENGHVSDIKDCNATYLDKDGEDREINVSFLHFIVFDSELKSYIHSYIHVHTPTCMHV